MKGIILKDSIELFGFKEGFKFWFKWNISDPLKIFYWKYIIARPLCTEHGYFMCKPDCQYKKIIGRKNIINFEKERHKQIEKESKTIIVGKKGECAYCGEEKGTELIDDPNWDTIERWKVCENCKEVLEIQQELTFLSLSKIDNPKRMEELNNKLLKIAKKTGKPIMNAQFEKVITKFEINKEGKVKETGHEYKSSSTIFTGKKDGR